MILMLESGKLYLDCEGGLWKSGEVFYSDFYCENRIKMSQLSGPRVGLKQDLIPDRATLPQHRRDFFVKEVRP